MAAVCPGPYVSPEPSMKQTPYPTFFRNILLSVVVAVSLVGMMAGIPLTAVRAQDACNSVACVWVDCSYTSYQCDEDAYGNPINCHWVTTFKPKGCCQIPQSGGGSCTCCYDGGCYFNCPAGGGGGGGTDPTAVPTPTPPNPATLTAIAKQVTSTDTSCTAVRASTTGVTGTIFGFTASSANQPNPKTQAGAATVTFGGQPPGWYTLTATPPNANWAAVNSCIYKNSTLYSIGWTALANGGDTVGWEIGYTYGTPWAQTSGGDVYASGILRSYVPATTPRVFNADSTGGYPGVVTYGTSYDFDSSTTSTGGTLVSSQNWLINATNAVVNYYDFFYRRFGSPTTPTTEPAFSNLLAVTKPPSSETPYYVVGDMTTSGNWSVGTGESIVILVNGNLTLGGRINITGSGFITFIVNGNITVDTAVGTGPTSSTPVVEGIYITASTGTFITGASTAAATSRFVGKGMFVAGGFLLQRDLENYGDNTTHAPELFTYNPQLLFTMPQSMMEVPVKWQEVAP